MKRINHLSEDRILIKKIDKGDEAALSILYAKYKMIGEKHARIDFAQRGYDKTIADEYIGEIDIVFITAFSKFDRRSPSFRAYFIAILSNSINKYIGRVLRNNDALKHYVPLDQTYENTPLYELIEDSTISVGSMVNQVLDAQRVISSFESSLTKKKKDITKALIILKSQGYTLTEIANLLSISESTISRLYLDFRKSINIK